MKDNQNLMIEFVKIVQRYPEVYDTSLDTYRTRFSEMAWAKIASQVRSELNEECTIAELKVKWKGIRSSFNRYKSKLKSVETGADLPLNNETTCKKYYLCDHLRFLEPFLRSKGSPSNEGDKSETTINESCNYVNVDGIEETHDYALEEEWNHIEIKPDVTTRLDKQNEVESLQSTRSDNSETYCDRTKKRKFSFEGLTSTEDDNEDLTFFKSILPDIKNFTIREKRKLKMGILNLIDEIERERDT